jgi:glycine/D-amino acid oxidase-like deaminating enzyme
MADLSLQSLHDLRSGQTPWQQVGAPPDWSRGYPAQLSCDAVIVGAGITGAFMAERLTRRGLKVVVLDRQQPERASTAASTALLLWETDAPLRELEDRLGFAAAAGLFRRSYGAVHAIAKLVGALGIDCGFAARDSLYLAGDRLDSAALREEHGLRRSAGLAGALLDAGGVARLALRAEAALLSPGAAQADPVALAAGLMRAAQARGALLLSPLEAVAYDATGAGVAVATDRGTQIVGQALILATGYDMPACVPATAHRLLSTWVIATAPLPPESLWPSGALVWEASDPYLYMRTTADRRLIAGGGDADIVAATARDALTAGKVDELLGRVAARFRPLDPAQLAYVWSGLFGESADALPLIGAIPGMPNCYAAFGYGGNGITFSAIAAEMIDRLLQGERDPHAEMFALERSV